MAYLHTASFLVRHYECDAYGQAHCANYLRYMQEAAFEASAAVGYSEARYTQLGYHWLAYSTQIEYLAPLTYGDHFNVNTWVQDFRRVRSLRRYDFLRDGALIARAATDWVLINRETLRPVTVPPEMIAAYAAGDPIETLARRDPLPKSTRPEQGVFEAQRRAQWRDLDPVAHVNNSVYVHYAEDCGEEVRRACGWPVGRIEAMGCRVMARQHQVEYKLPAQLADELRIETWLSHLGENSLVRHYEITRNSDGKLLNRVRARYQWVSLKTGEVMPVPRTYVDDLATNVAAETTHP